MNDQLAERIAVALEQLVLEVMDGKGQANGAEGVIRAAMSAPLPSPMPMPAPAVTGVTGVTVPERFPPMGWRCPTHGSSKVVPAGVSNRTGNPYSAFVCCDVQGCQERPPRANQQAPARAIPPSQGPQQLP